MIRHMIRHMIRRARTLMTASMLTLGLLVAFATTLASGPTAQAHASWTTCGQVAQVGPTYYWHDVTTVFTMYVTFQKQYDPTELCGVRMHAWIASTADVSGYDYGGNTYNTRIQGVIRYGAALNQTGVAYASTVMVPHYATTTNTYTGWVAGPCMHGFISLVDTTGKTLQTIYGPADPNYSAYTPAPAWETLCA
jgi:hypothetical protein